MGNTESAESAGIFAISGKILRGFRHFPNAKFTAFLPCFRLGGPFSGRYFLAFAAQAGTYSRRLIEGVCPSLPTSTGRPGGFLGNAESAKSAEGAESAGIFAIFWENT